MSITLWEWQDGPREVKDRVSMEVHPTKIKRPIGFAPWPKSKKKRKKK